ncbi:dienelactone hydrolase family protein [Williamsia sterculiae]|uniref:Chlorophyllase enzyme n=1 Tax=Williamsia sterculiae TaxID=1344003 RepID=A0A1N7DU77_9NOCA|nr:hypothetical protein [Williamsia sterculiae]SIR79380.1 hypothetical protein SAMN05445060_0910 [Williamsia sterculiae]
MASVKKLISELTRRGPHKVLRGDLAIAGVPGAVYTPRSGTDLPGIALGHGWMTGSRQYRKTLSHLASWGIVAAAPDTERGPLGSERALASDLVTTLQIISEVRLGVGDITVHSRRLGLVGHGFGASAAVLAAADSSPVTVRAAGLLYPAPTSDAVLPAAHNARVPAMILTAPDDLDSITSNALPLRNALHHDLSPDALAKGAEENPVSLRVVEKSTARGFAEGFSVRGFLGDGANDRTTQRMTRAVLTGFLLHQLTGDKKYADFSDPDTALGKIVPLDPTTVADETDPLTRLLSR